MPLADISVTNHLAQSEELRLRFCARQDAMLDAQLKLNAMILHLCVTGHKPFTWCFAPDGVVFNLLTDWI